MCLYCCKYIYLSQINYTTKDNTRKEDGSMKNDSEHKCSETFQGIVARADPGSYSNQM